MKPKIKKYLTSMALRMKTYKNSGEDLCDKEHVVKEFLQNRFEYIVRDTLSLMVSQLVFIPLLSKSLGFHLR